MTRYTILIFLLIESFAFSQTSIDGINIQGQFLETNNSSTVNLSLLVLSNTNDTIWLEEHPNTLLDENKTFTLILGQGDYVNGNQQTFNKINWLEVSEIKILNPSSNNSKEMASFDLYSVPFSLHSLKTQVKPSTIELIDISNFPIQNGAILKYDNFGFNGQFDNRSDSTLHAFYSDTAVYVDTVLTAIFNLYSDSSIISLFSDTSLFSNIIGHVIYADSSSYARSTRIAAQSIGNWDLNGNSGLADTNFIGTTGANDLHINTNDINRLSLRHTGEITNNVSSSNTGFNLNTTKGAFFNLQSGNELIMFDDSHLYFEGSSAAFRGGSLISGLDSLKGFCSFSWGENSGTNGRYSTVFGKNSFGDSTFSSTAAFDAISSFAFGKNCRTARMGVAIGENCVAGRYRNVAIGKNVTASVASSSVGIGENVLATGSTSWAAGRNATASGNFSTAIGKNVSTNAFSGSFAFGDNSTSDTVFNTSVNQFIARSSNGVIFYSSSNANMGVQLAAGGGSWNMISDRSKKKNISKVRYQRFIPTIEETPIYSWFYKGEPIRHISPMAQDFNSNFNTGELITYINMLDIDGVTLMGIKSLNKTINKKLEPKEILNLQKEIEKEKKAINDLERRLNILYEKMDH